jgi:hypothetical protein
MSAIVKPANAPPRRTRPTATARYTHNVGLCAGNGLGPSDVENDVPLVGNAPKNGRFRRPRMRSFPTEYNAGLDKIDADGFPRYAESIIPDISVTR